MQQIAQIKTDIRLILLILLIFLVISFVGKHKDCCSSITVQFQIVRHPYVTVTHLTKFSFRHLA